MEDAPNKQRLFLKNAYSVVMEERRGVAITGDTLNYYMGMMSGNPTKKLIAVIKNRTNIDGLNIPVKIRIRELRFPKNTENRYYTHNFIKNIWERQPG